MSAPTPITTVEDVKKEVLTIVTPTFCSGTLPLNRSQGGVFFSKGESSDASVINFADENLKDADIAKLVEASQRATFGRGDQDALKILDESYRKAWKMDSSQFSPQFDVIHSGVMDIVQEQLLHYEKGSVKLDPRLYELNVYGPGSFFKPHVDTPRGDDLFATLVVVLPTVHTGGSLLLGKGGKLLDFDSSTSVYHPGTKAPQIAFAAFYSDIEHEVTPVEVGYRVTLTYNLHLVKTDSVVPKEVPAKPLQKLVANLMKLMLNPEVLPKGGALGFGLLHKYPVDAKEVSLQEFSGALKGNDALVATACRRLGMKPTVRVVYGYDTEECIVDFVEGDGSSEYGEMSLQEMLSGEGFRSAPRVRDPSYRRISDRSLPILWVTPRMKMMTTEFAWSVCHDIDRVYGDFVLTAELKPLRDRVAWLVNAFPDLKEKYEGRLEEMIEQAGRGEDEDEDEDEEDSDMSDY
ncbi:hypothetical protein EST38_g9650 [Candolleomyces aberdarensis]|uniref:Fe2OG dioxygenase domain-containing protein n=1 Tax=Candolleomyces aberdarensis TaxID=2316362 RepID=A0A4Q2DB34_9AGAR|nr:hypothetical protein EST38_g9650 [Candolleomyces aberdarensis]